MGFYQHHVLPRLRHLAMRQEAMLPFRRRVIATSEGRVLEIGIGSGLNLPLYGLSVREVIGLDPLPELLVMARNRGDSRQTARSLRRSDPTRRCQHRHRGNDLDTLHYP